MIDNKELILYALADAEKYWRQRRRKVQLGEDSLYTVGECTQKMYEYRNEFNRLNND